MKINAFFDKFNFNSIKFAQIFLIFIIFSLIFATVPTFSQMIKLDNWKVYTSMMHTYTAATDSQNRIWIGSEGGIMIYDENENSSENDEQINENKPILINTNNGLLSNFTTVIKHIPNTSMMLIGSNSGILEIISEDLTTFRHITSIRDYNFNNPRINDIYFLTNSNNNSETKTAIFAGNFGLAEFDLEKEIFTNQVLNIGDFPRNTPVNNIIVDKDTLWVATSIGLACISLNQQINVPNNWKTFHYDNNNGNNVTYLYAKFVKFNDKFYVNIRTNILVFENGVFSNILKALEHTEIRDIGIYQNQLTFANIFSVIRITNLDSAGLIDIEQNADRIAHIYTNWDYRLQGFVTLEHPKVNIVAFSPELGNVFIYNDLTVEIKTPNTPHIDYFLGLSLDKNGKLFAVTNNSQSTNGISAVNMAFDGENWTNYNPLSSTIPAILYCRSITVSPDNKVYASAWGGGLLIMDENDADSTKYSSYHSGNSAFSGYMEGEGFTVVGQVAFDSRKNAWATNYSYNSGNMVVMIDADGNSHGFVCPLINSRYVFNLTVDANDTKWICGHSGEANPGLFYFNEKGTLNNTDDDVWGHITSSSNANLLGNAFHACVYDKFMNYVWLGTASGVAIITNPGAALSNSSLFIMKNKLLEGQHINDIFIDAIGYKWIATNNGLWVISVDGTELIAHFTTENSLLSTNETQAVTINSANGLVYIGTREGLFVAQGASMMPRNDYSIMTFPQPFNIEKDGELVIDGLTAESDIRIITPSGRLVRSILTSSRRAIWDGKDNNGNKVPIGVYLIISSSTVTKSSAAGKIAVVE